MRGEFVGEEWTEVFAGDDCSGQFVVCMIDIADIRILI